MKPGLDFKQDYDQIETGEADLEPVKSKASS